MSRARSVSQLVGANTALGNTVITGTANVSSTLAAGNTTITGDLTSSGDGTFNGGDIIISKAHGSGSYPSLILKNATAGTTYSGRVQFVDGNGNNGWNIGTNVTQGTGILEFNDNTTARMIIDGSGRVTMPYQPAFAVSKNGGQSNTLASDAVLNFDFVVSNRGSHYSTSTNRFTAPVAGHYMFCVHLYHNNTANNMPAGTASRVMIKKNGNQYFNGTDVIPHAYVKGNGDDMTSSTSMILDLAANDYVTVAVRQGQTACYYGGHSHFYGYLIG